MWRIEGTATAADDPPDLVERLEVVRTRTDFFAPGRPVVVARAPGRLDLMGGIADYSGSLVLQLPLAAATYVAAQADDEPLLTVASEGAATAGDEPVVAVPLEALVPGTAVAAEVTGRHLADYRALHETLTAEPRRRWVAYVAGALAVLRGERSRSGEPYLRRPGPAHGARLLVHSTVPMGKGVSSSAALEVAAMRALCALYGVELAPRELALLCQKVENAVAGAPCGVMDQMTAACGTRDRLLALRCQPAELEEAVTLPPEVEVWGIDSGIRHAVSGADYTSVRVGAFIGYRIVADLAGLPAGRGPDGRVRIEDPRWQGYLANVSPAEWASRYEHAVPETLDGETFLRRYGGLTDPVTAVEPGRTYAVRAPTAHPIFEHHRVRLYRALLQGGSPDDERLSLLGELMYQSHASYSACGLGSDGTDRLVELVQRAGPAVGLFGAKITGGGCGGTVAVLARRGARPQVEAIRARYEAETGRRSLILAGSSSGADRFGVRTLVPVHGA